jgi:hypothetical protein
VHMVYSSSGNELDDEYPILGTAITIKGHPAQRQPRPFIDFLRPDDIFLVTINRGKGIADIVCDYAHSHRRSIRDSVSELWLEQIINWQQERK